MGNWENIKGEEGEEYTWWEMEGLEAETGAYSHYRLKSKYVSFPPYAAFLNSLTDFVQPANDS